MHKKNIKNPNYQRNGAPIWPISGINSTRNGKAEYSLCRYSNGTLMVEKNGHGRLVDEKDFDLFCQLMHKGGK